MRGPKLSLVGPGLPERLSVLQGDVRYDEKAKSLSDRIDVFLDATLLEEVATYDVPAGKIVRQRRSYSDGALILDERGVPELETLKGKVEVRWQRGEGAQ